MSKFTLLESLGKKLQTSTKSHEIKYQQYFVKCEGQKIEILVPLSECEKFETSLTTFDSSRLELRGLLRKHRAIKEQ